MDNFGSSKNILFSSFFLPPLFIYHSSSTQDCAKWILQQFELCAKNSTPLPTLISLIEEAAKVSKRSLASIKLKYHRSKNDIDKPHGNSLCSEDELIATAAITKNMASTNGGLTTSALREVIKRVTERKWVSRTSVHCLTKKHPNLFGVKTIKTSSTARTDRVRVSIAIQEYILAASKVFEDNHYPTHAVLATDQYVISKSKGIFFFIYLH